MKVRDLIEKLEQLGDEYKDSEVTIQETRNHFMPIKNVIDTDYCRNEKNGKFETIVVLKEKRS